MNQTCRCCEGLEPLTPLVVANRPGLSRLAYRAGTHATFLASMKARLSARKYPALRKGLNTRSAADPAVALLDAWATVADVLTFYQERIANEGYLRTATERRSVLELARLVGYALRPGVASSVYLAFTLEPDSTAEIPAGTRAQSVPGPGELPQPFETAEKVEARAAWNTLRPRLTQPQLFVPEDPSTFDTLYFQDAATVLNPNDALLFVFGEGVEQQSFRRAATVEAQPLQDRTKVTLQTDDAAAPLNGSAESEVIGDMGELIESLRRPPSVPPANPLRLERDLAEIFGRDSDTTAQLLVSHDPALSATSLYAALANANVTAPSALENSEVFRVTAAPFGHNAPLKPIYDRRGVIVNYKEWTLSGTNTVTVSVRLLSLASIGATSTSRDLRALLSITRNGETRSEQVPLAQVTSITVAELGATINVDVGANSIEFVFDDPDRVFKVTPNTAGIPEVKVEISGDRERVLIYGQTLHYPIDQRQISLAFDPPSQTEGSSVSIVDESPPEEPPNPRVLTLNARYDQIVPNSWVVIRRPETGGTRRHEIIAKVVATETLSVTNYGIPATEVTQLTLDREWLSTGDTSLAVVRNTTVFAQGELLVPAEEPVEDEVHGDTIELDSLYGGLEPGRWLIVSGERTDIRGTSGVAASEVVMLAGVTQGVQPVRMIAGRGTVVTPQGDDGDISYEIEISAYLLHDGSAAGHARITRIDGDPPPATGNVVQIVPPSAPDKRDFWCINIKPTGTGSDADDRWINLYIQDVGDGEKTHDRVTVNAATGLDYTTSPDPPPDLGWMDVVEGDFKESVGLPDDKTHSFLRLARPLSYRYRRDTVTIYGNVARATHGETRTEVLGSGDSSKALQQFTLKQSPLTYVAATTPSGTESTLQVFVDDVRWREAERLVGLEPTDRRFVTRTSDEDEVTLVFGDGERGARLPTGAENVRAVYRTGIGKPGNVEAKQISQLVTRPRGLQSVINPLPATGGADRESQDQARRNAPLALIALDRLVSVQDYADFARTFAGIGKASATRLSDGSRQLVHLTVAGADDVPIAEDSDLYRNLVQALRQFGDPQQPLRVEVRQLIMLISSARVRVLPDYQWESVERKIRTAVLDAFGFERRELGQDALLSEVVSAIQAVPGVAYVDVDAFGGVPEKIEGSDGKWRSILPSEIADRIRAIAIEGERDGPRPRVTVELARAVDQLGLDRRVIYPAQLAFFTPRVPETLILAEITP